MRDRLVARTVLACVFYLCTGGAALAADAPPKPDDDTPIPETTPPRLALIEGSASFWRPGAEGWTPAQVNTALAAGDRLYTDEDSNLELQLDARVFVRAGEKTQLGVANIEPDFVQFELTIGQASIDVREIDPGHTIAVATPNAAFTIEHTGYYRVNVNGDTSAFITRRAGRAIVTPEGGRAGAISPSEQVVVQGEGSPTVETYVAPDLDDWDRWNYARTDRLLDSMSARYVSPGVAGTADLDYNGTWRVVPTYGPVWIPRGVARGWAPYTTGRWVLDPYYGWTWVDYAPWGWAPYHYGRWVYLDSYWAWAPGPLVVRAAYAPALVVFFGGDNWSIGLNLGGPAIGWFALGWGEPCYPWWGPAYWRYYPWWGGWGGHRRWHHKDHDHDHDGDHDHDHDGDHDGDHDRDRDRHRVHDYENARVPRAVSVERTDAFGRYGGGNGEGRHRVERFDDGNVEPIRGALPVRATPASLSPATGGGTKRPPAATENRPVVATRAPQDPSRGLREAGVPLSSTPATSPVRVVPAPPKGGGTGDTPRVSRPPFGSGGRERPEPPAPPPYRPRVSSGGASKGTPNVSRPNAGGAKASARPSSPVISQPRPQTHAPQPQARPSQPRRSTGGGAASTRQPSAPPSSHPAPSVRKAPPSGATSRPPSSGRGSTSSRGSPNVQSTPSPGASQRPSGSLPGVPANRVFGGWGKKK
jgi:hypothetical protein